MCFRRCWNKKRKRVLELGRVLRSQARGSSVRALLPTCFHLFPLVSDMFPTLVELGLVLRGQGGESGVGALLPTCFHLFPLVSDLFPTPL